MSTKLTAIAVFAATAATLAAVAAAGPVAARPAEVVASISPPLGALPPYGGSAQAFAFDPRRPDIVYVATVGYPHGTTRAHVFKTTDGGRHWHSTATRGSGWTGDVVTLAADPRHPGTLYAGTNVAVYKTADGGRSWQPWNRGLFPPPGPNRPYGTPGTPSFNRGNGWVTSIVVDPANTNIVYSAADAVRKSTDGGHSWRTVFLPYPSQYRGAVSVSALAIAPTRPEAIYAIANDVNGLTSIYKSTDAGKTWHPTSGSGGVFNGSGNALAVDPQRPTILYAAIDRTVVRSTGGTSWQPITNGLPTDNVANALAVDPRRSGTAYAGVTTYRIYKPGTVSKTTGGIYVTTDGGDTWRPAFQGFGVGALAVDPARPTTIYAAGWARWNNTHIDEFRILRSTDGGSTWAVSGAR